MIKRLDITGDPVDNFFENLPTYDDYVRVGYKEFWSKIQYVGSRYAVQILNKPCSDRETQLFLFGSLMGHWEALRSEARGNGEVNESKPLWILQQVAIMALKCPPSPDDMSNKAKALHFCLWITCCRKEDSLPNQPPVTGPETDHSLLPEGLLGDSCAACGKQGATMRCSPCLIKNGDNCSHETIRTLYCDWTCQAQPWPKHRQISRVVKLYEEVWEHFMDLTEFHFRPKNINISVCRMTPDRFEFSGMPGHNVLRLTLSSARQVVLDPTRAQFGWKEALSPWESHPQAPRLDDECRASGGVL